MDAKICVCLVLFLTTQLLAEEMETRDVCASPNYGMHIYGASEKRICLILHDPKVFKASELHLPHQTQDFQIGCICDQIVPIK
jgi:hypothetical protein